MLRSRIGGLALLLGTVACAHHATPAATPPSPAQSSASSDESSTNTDGFQAPDASTQTFLHQHSASKERRLTASYEDMDIHDVLAQFAAFSGRRIIAGRGVVGTVTVEVHNLPWDVALQSILSRQQLVASEGEDGTITVHAE